MKTKKWVILSIITMFVVLVSVQVSALSYFVNGNTYQQFSSNEKEKYVVGILDGWGYAKLEPFLHCSDKLLPMQPVAIVNKYMKDNPERWHYAMVSLVQDSLRSFCLKRAEEAEKKS